MLDEPSREVWDHDGVCACGTRTYLFSRCPSCIQAEASDDEVGIEVGSTLALLSDVAVTVVLSSELLVSWAAGYLAVPT